MSYDMIGLAGMKFRMKMGGGGGGDSLKFNLSQSVKEHCSIIFAS